MERKKERKKKKKGPQFRSCRKGSVEDSQQKIRRGGDPLRVPPAMQPHREATGDAGRMGALHAGTASSEGMGNYVRRSALCWSPVQRTQSARWARRALGEVGIHYRSGLSGALHRSGAGVIGTALGILRPRVEDALGPGGSNRRIS